MLISRNKNANARQPGRAILGWRGPHIPSGGEKELTMPAKLRFLLLNLLASVALAHAGWCAPKYTVMHSFSGGNDGEMLWGSLLLDAQGNTYGTTYYGGANGAGTVFQLSPKRNGKWSETTLWSFNGTDGQASTAGLILDTLGNLYGTTKVGGVYAEGTVFELSPQGDGTWSESVLYSFNQGPVVPYAGVIMDPSGNLFGTGGGYAYELSPGSNGWALTSLYLVLGGSGLIRNGAGNLYGTTFYCGGSKNCDAGCGTVYRLHPNADGTWQETILHDFIAGRDGAFPGPGALAMDKSGNLYGTTEVGGDTGSGVIFRLKPGARGRWQETILYSIPGGNQGSGPVGGVVIGKGGILYGTTSAGGRGCGVVYKLAPGAEGKWKYTVLHTLLGSDGCSPDATLILDSKGNLYGTTTGGGAYGGGVVFELTP